MRVVLTIPDEARELFIRFRTIDGVIASQVIRDGCLTDSKYIDKGENVNLRYAEGLEKRIDAIETELREEIPRKFGVAHDTFVKLDKRIEELEAGLGKVYESLENNYNELDTAIDAVRIDAEAFKSLPKSTGEVDATANRGVYTDILRRLKELEERAKTSRPTWDNFSLHDQRICKLESRMEDAEKKAAVAESVRKQLAADIKAANGRIQNLEEKTGQTRDRLYAY